MVLVLPSHLGKEFWDCEDGVGEMTVSVIRCVSGVEVVVQWQAQLEPEEMTVRAVQGRGGVGGV